jgi:hypothetical protein
MSNSLPSGTEIIAEESRHRQGRLIERLEYELLHNHNLTYEVRQEAVTRLELWKLEKGTNQ